MRWLALLAWIDPSTEWLFRAAAIHFLSMFGPVPDYIFQNVNTNALDFLDSGLPLLLSALALKAILNCVGRFRIYVKLWAD